MNLFITGGAGFIGSNFVRYMLKKHPDYKIMVLDKLTYAGNLDNLKEFLHGDNVFLRDDYETPYPHHSINSFEAFPDKIESVRQILSNHPILFIQGDICDSQLVGRIMPGADVVVSFAAESHVDRSILEAGSFVRTDVYGTYVLLEAARKCNIKKYIQISCYDEKTRALTTEGLKTYDELKKGDQVFSLNPVTREIEIRPIEKIISQPYKGKMIHLNNQRINLLVTPNHNMFIISTNKKKLLVETAEKASRRSIFYMPEGYWVGKKEEHFEIKAYGRVKTKDLMYILGIFIGDGFTAYQEKEVETKTGLARKEYLEKSRDENSGRFKKIEKQSNYKSKIHSYRIFFDIPENDKSRKKAEETLSNLGVRYHCHKRKAGMHLYFTSKVFMELFNQCGQGAHDKHIPRWALDYSPEYLRYLLQGLMDSDGHDNKMYYTVSKRLVSDICELCIKLNLKPSVRINHSKSFINGRKIEGDIYCIFVANTTKSISRHRNKIVNYEGNIWCLKVKDNKNFIVERNGRFDFCGNTDEVYGSREKGSFKEEDPLNPSSPYAASKAAADLLIKSYYATYDLPVVITRSSNNFGPYQHPEKLIPLFITNAMDSQYLPLYGDGMNVRDWLYVIDNCSAIDLVLHKGRIGEVYNIGADNEKANVEITRMILRLLGKPESLIQLVQDRPGHDRRYALNSSKMKRLGWKTSYDFKEAMKETVDWYVNNENWWRKVKEKSREFREYYQKQYGQRGRAL